ncbi:hypothetical protein KPH14_012748 [Odynerus spinipes]|uniref:Uncharacterized protein n=1 Tax=Odynerus spinipes TaxID=1348599 RepID=A0AAD9RF42_9HYME|nr:hypothetical protein KPH14_012748 [Odynerus spinipes]
MGRIWNGFTAFGSISAGILAIFIIFKIIKTIIDAIIQGMVIHSAYGCSVYIFAALWDTVASMLLRKAEKKQDVTKNVPPGQLHREATPSPTPIMTRVSIPDLSPHTLYTEMNERY